MKQLTYIKKGVLRWDNVPEPELPGPTAALVRPFVVARCDLDATFLHSDLSRSYSIGRMFGLVDRDIDSFMRRDLLKGPFAIGHECIAEVVEVGADVPGVAVGDRVIVPFQVSCGTCPMCATRLTSQCDTYGSFDMYSGIGRHTTRGGMLSDVVVVPEARHMLIPVPPGLDPIAIGSASDNLPDAWSRVAPELLGKAGKTVLVVAGSTRSIGLYCVAFAVAMGAERVDYLDRNTERRSIAAALGANVLSGELADLGPHYNLVVNGTSRRSAIADSIRCLKPGGVCTSMNVYLNKSVPVPYFQLYAKNLTLKSGLANSMADIRPMLSFIEKHDLKVGLVNSHVARWEDAATAMLENTTKVMIHRAPLSN